jgi:hypothetical protein
MTSCLYKTYEERHYRLMNSILPIAQIFDLYQSQNFLFRPPRQWASDRIAACRLGIG